MADKNTWRTVCLDAGDESGDVIIELPAELLDKLGWSVGDQLVVEKTDDLLPLKLKPRTSRTVQTRVSEFLCNRLMSDTVAPNRRHHEQDATSHH